MAIKYQVIGCSNPAGEEGVDYACCRAVIPDKVTFVDLAQEVEHATSATKADVVGVLTSFKEFVRKALAYPENFGSGRPYDIGPVVERWPERVRKMGK